MNKIDWSGAAPITAADLPATVTDYLDAHRARDLDRAVRMFAQEAVVTDEGQVHHGPDAIRAWLSSAGTGYTYTSTLTGAFRADADHVDAVHHLEGDFPGGVADLHFRFALDGEHIKALVIEA